MENMCNLGMLLPSNAFLALAAVSASVYWISACKMFQSNEGKLQPADPAKGSKVVSPESQQLFQMLQFYAQTQKQRTPKTKLKAFSC